MQIWTIYEIHIFKKLGCTNPLIYVTPSVHPVAGYSRTKSVMLKFFANPPSDTKFLLVP